MLRTALVTGGNRGIGKEVCRQLAQRDVHVVLASRSLTDGEEAAAELRDGGHESITVMTLDVSSQASVTACATELSKRSSPSRRCASPYDSNASTCDAPSTDMSQTAPCKRNIRYLNKYELKVQL